MKNFLKSFLDTVKGHRTMLLSGFCLITFTLLIVYLAIAEKVDVLTLILGSLPTIGGFIFLLAVAAQQDKYAEGISSRLQVGPKQ